MFIKDIQTLFISIFLSFNISINYTRAFSNGVTPLHFLVFKSYNYVNVCSAED